MSESRRVASGVKWAFVSQAGMRLTQLATTVVLARLLEPEDFGLVGMALAVVFLVDVFKDLGTTSALVQAEAPPEELVSSVFWVQGATGLVAMLLVAALAPAAAALYGSEAVTPLLRWLSLGFFVSGLGLTHQTLLTRDLAFDRLARCEIGATVAGGVAGIAAALAGYGAMSLVIQTLVFASASTLLLWLARPWWPQLVFSWPAVRSITRYSAELTAHGLLNYAARHADTLLVGTLLGPTALGYYNMAYRVMLLPLDSVSRVLGRVMFPVLSRLQGDDPRFRRVYLRWIGSVALVSFPLMLGLWATAEPLVHVVLGEKWSRLVPLLLILAPAGALQSIVATVGSIYKAKAGTGRLLRFGVVGSTVSVACYALGARYGVEGVAAGCTAATLILALPNFALAFDLVGLRVVEAWHAVRLPLLNAALMLGVMLLARETLGLHEPHAAPLAALVALGSLTYAAATLASSRDEMRTLWTALYSR